MKHFWQCKLIFSRNFLKKFLSAPFVPIIKLKTSKCYTNLDILWLSWTSIVSILALFTTEYDAALKLKALSSIDRKVELNNETGLSVQQMTMYHFDLIYPPPFDKPLHLFSMTSFPKYKNFPVRSLYMYLETLASDSNYHFYSKKVLNFPLKGN